MILSSEEFRKKAPMYKTWCREYLKQQNIVNDIEYQMSKIPSTWPETITIKGKEIAVPKTHGDPKQKEIHRLEMIEKKAEHERIRDEYKSKCQEIEQALDKLPQELRKLVEIIYIKKNKIEHVAKDMGYTKQGLYDYIDKRLESTLEPK